MQIDETINSIKYIRNCKNQSFSTFKPWGVMCILSIKFPFVRIFRTGFINKTSATKFPVVHVRYFLPHIFSHSPCNYHTATRWQCFPECLIYFICQFYTDITDLSMTNSVFELKSIISPILHTQRQTNQPLTERLPINFWWIHKNLKNGYWIT